MLNENLELNLENTKKNQANTYNSPDEWLEEDTFNYYSSVTPIELLGYSKNDIIEAKKMVENLPDTIIDKLNQAFSLLDEVQEYLYTA
jgi:hypothetical protein